MRLWFTLLAGFIAFHPSSTFAAKIIGNGGDAVVCPSDSKILLLDLHEAKNRGWKLIEAPENGDYVQIVLGIAERLDQQAPSLASAIRRELDNFLANLKYHDHNLRNIKDAYEDGVPDGCELQQMIIQKEPVFPNDPWYVINRKLWNQTTPLQKAGFVIHEIIYHLGIPNGLEHSIGVRYLTGMLFTKDWRQFTDRHWVDSFRESRIRFFEKKGAKFPLFSGDGAAGGFRTALTQFDAGGNLRTISFYRHPQSWAFVRFMINGTALYVNTQSLNFGLKNGVGLAGDALVQEGGHIAGLPDQFYWSGEIRAETAYLCGDISEPKQSICGTLK